MQKTLLVDLSPYSDQNWPHSPEWNRLGVEIGGYAQSAAKALPLLGGDAFTLIVIHIDNGNSQSEGIKLCKQLRVSSRAPILLVGGRRDFQTAREALKCQVNDYLPAPFTAKDMQISLQSLFTLPESGKSGPSQMEANSEREQASQEGSGVIHRIKEYVESSLHENITLKEISMNLHFNCSYLGQKFKVHENMTFNEFLLKRRMEKAKDLLEQTNLKIYEIANKVGYTEIDWFYKKFKAYTGLSANEYRKTLSITA